MEFNKYVLIRVSNIKWILDLSTTLGALNRLFSDLKTQTLNSTTGTTKSCKSVSCPESIFMGLSSSSKVSFHFLTISPVGVSISLILLRTASLFSPPGLLKGFQNTLGWLIGAFASNLQRRQLPSPNVNKQLLGLPPWQALTLATAWPYDSISSQISELVFLLLHFLLTVRNKNS